MDTMSETYLRETMEGLIQFQSPRLYHEYWTACPAAEEERRQREGGQHTDLSARMDTPIRTPAGVGSPTAPPPSMDLSSMTDMAELTRPVDRAQLDQEIEDFNLSYPVNVDEAVNLFSLPPVAGTGTAPATTQPVTTATQTPPVTSTRTRPVTTTTTSRSRPVTSTQTRPVTTAPSRPLTARRSAGAGTRTTTSTVTTPSGRPRIAAKQPRRRPRVPSPPPPPDSSPPPSDDDGDDDDEDRRRGLRRRLDLLNEDAQQRARGRRIRNITHTNTVTTVYEEGGGRPSVCRTSTRMSSPSPPPSPPPPRRGRGRDRGRGRVRGRGRRS